MALLDLIFNLGMTALKRDWPRLNKVVKAKNWGKAATESNRPELGDLRNSYVRELFEAAVAKDTGKNIAP